VGNGDFLIKVWGEEKKRKKERNDRSGWAMQMMEERWVNYTSRPRLQDNSAVLARVFVGRGIIAGISRT
jgi:hypothetical protein